MTQQESQTPSGSITSPCPVCGGLRIAAFRATVLGRYDVQYLYCRTCGLLQTENPYWLKESYASPIAIADTGQVQRCLELAERMIPLLLRLSEPSDRFVDWSGGTGLFARLMRDAGFDFRWHDPYTANVHARGFEFVPESGPYRASTLFEVLEHVHDPIPFLADLFARTGVPLLFLTTELFEGNPPAPDAWPYYSFMTGQHVSFYQRRTLQEIAARLDLYFLTGGGLHCLSREPLKPLLYRALSHPAIRLLAPLLRRRRPGLMMKDHYTLMRNSLRK